MMKMQPELQQTAHSSWDYPTIKCVQDSWQHSSERPNTGTGRAVIMIPVWIMCPFTSNHMQSCGVCLVSGLNGRTGPVPAAFFLRSASLFSFLEGAELSVIMDACFRSSSVITNTGLFLTSWETHHKKQTVSHLMFHSYFSMDMYDRRLHLLSFLLHGFIKQCEAVADELLADHDSSS